MSEILRILLIEDNPGDARLIHEMMKDATLGKFTMHVASTLKEGLAYQRENPGNLILLDLSLPDSKGIDTLVQVHAAAPDQAIVVLTGYDNEEMGFEAVQLGAQDYLPKSNLGSRMLVRSIRYAVERHRSEMALRRSEQEYRSLIDDVFNTSTVAVLILDRDYKVVWCNESTGVYFGIPSEHLIGHDKRRLIDDELKCIFADPDDYSRHLLKAYENGIFTDRYECMVTADSTREERWLEQWSQPIRSGMYAGGRIEQYTDITDRKRLEFAEYEQSQFAESLRDIAALLTSTLRLNDVLDRILMTLDRVVPHESATITIIEDDYFHIASRYNYENDKGQNISTHKQLESAYRPYLRQMMSSQTPLIVGDLQSDNSGEESTRAQAISTGIHAYIGVPIRLQNQVIGFVNLFSTTPDFFTEQHSERLLAFAELASIAIQNARLYEQSQELAMLQERQRLARDLHDSVSQTLFTCRSMAEGALRRWDRDPKRARELVEDVHQLAMTALAEMRILLLELRPSTMTHVSLKQLFEQYLKPIQERRHFKLELHLDEIPTLPPKVQIALYRITQEALNNIDKHAQASHVVVAVRYDDGSIRLRIEDDGLGFVVEDIDGGQMGLSIMRERAAEQGIDLQIESSVNQGTRITLVWLMKLAEPIN